MLEATHGEIHLLDYWRMLLRRRWVIILALVATVLVALVGSFLTTPLYRATVTLQVERQSPDILTFRDLARSDYSWAAYSDFYQTQYRIMSSPAVARKAVERLGLDSHPAFEKRRSKPTLMARLKSLLPRKGAATPPDPLDVAASQLLGGLEIEPVRESTLVMIGWVGTNPALSADVANAMADAYISYTIESQFSMTEQAGEFLVNQIGKLKREIAEAEQLLQSYGEAKRIVSINDEANITMQGLRELAQERIDAQTALARAAAYRAAVIESPPDGLPQVLQSNLINRLREEYAQLEAEYAEMSRRFKADWPELQTLRFKLDGAAARLELETTRIAEQVRAAAAADYQRAMSQVQNLERLLSEQEEAAQQLRRDSVEYATLRSEVEEKRETLNRLMKRQNEMALSAELRDLDSTSTYVRVVERAKAPGAPFRPNIKLNLLLALLFGSALGVGMALLLDYLDNTVKSASDLERMVGKPVLAVVPFHGKAAGTTLVRRKQPAPASQAFDMVSHLEGRTSVAEAYRELRTAILLSHAGEPPRLIMITSAVPEEGKSATSVNLAIVLAQLGRRVLLVDTDLRRPRLHRALDVPNPRGVSTYLSGLEDDPGPLIVPTPVDNLSILPSGPIPPNPSELLNAPRFTQLGRELAARGFDHVVFDSPPVLSVVDPIIIASTADSTLLVVRAGRTARQSVRMAADKLAQAGGAPSGLVLNGLEREGHDAHYYYYRSEYVAGSEASAAADPARKRADSA